MWKNDFNLFRDQCILRNIFVHENLNNIYQCAEKYGSFYEINLEHVLNMSLRKVLMFQVF